MSSDEGFFVRWARRKRGVARLSSADSRVSEVSDVTPPESTQPLSDPVSLPAVESIDAAADVRAFLAPGVPAELTRAALRRAWSADPAIRDFIGLSENSWDFNVPGAMGGFGSLTIEDARRLLAQAIGEPEPSISEDKPAPVLDSEKDLPRQEVTTGAARPDAAVDG